MIVIMSSTLKTLFVESRSINIDAGEVLFRRASPVSEMFFVKSGQIHLCRHTVHGAAMILQRATPGKILAEASAYSDIYHCDAIAPTLSTVLAMSKLSFLSAIASDPNLAATWSATLARGAQSARLRSEIRSLPKVADRLDAWFGEGNHLPERGHWQDVANELGITREALYRELSRRRKGTT